MNNINNFINILKNKPFIKSLINDLNAEVLAVGGVVRDLILNKPNKDIDLIIRRIPIDLLISYLQKFGKVDVVGKSFGVIKFIDSDGLDYDLALPRKEKPSGEGGYHGFEIQSDENLPIEDDLIRRDAKFNAMAININTGKFIDPLGGLNDIENKQISAANPEAFSDDPLRMLRMVSFASRFGFNIESQTMQMIIDNASRISEIPPDRIIIELKKILNKGDKKLGSNLLANTGLYTQIFGVLPKHDFNDINKSSTFGEFMYLLMQDSVPNPPEFFKNKLRGDNESYNEINAYFMAFNESIRVKTLVEARSIAFNMYKISPNSIKSQILPEVIKTACNELLSGKYPKTTIELAVNGQDLMNLGLKGKELGDAQKKLLINLYADKVANTKEDLIKILNKGYVQEGVGDKYAEKKFNIPDLDKEFEKDFKSYKQNEIEKPFGYVDIGNGKRVEVYKNPKSLNNFDDDVRAIGDIRGNLYVAVKNNGFLHGHMAKNIGLGSTLHDIYVKPSQFVLLHRIDNTNDFGFADSTSNQYYVPSTNKPLSYYKNAINNILKNIKAKNPQYNFYPKYFTSSESVEPIQEVELNETIKGGEYVMYHGSDHDITNFTDEFVGGENANDQEGPGIYFTSSITNARRYGNNVYKVILKPRKLADVARKSVVSAPVVTALIKASPSIDVNNEDSLSNWGVNPNIALRKAVASIIEYFENEKDLFQQIWVDFYRNYPREFVRNMVKIGYDGELIKLVDDIIHIIIYNPNSITSVEKLEDTQTNDMEKTPINEEYIMKDISYTAIVLNERSKNKLIETFKSRIPEGYRIIADHMTICLGKLPENQRDEIGLTKQLTVESFAIDDKVAAVGVTGFPSNNEHPYVTLAVNTENGGKPVMSNYLTNWEKALRIRISGVVTEVPYTI